MAADPYKEHILPETIRRPWVLLLVWVLPQAILLLLNLHAYDLASGELDKSQQTRFVTFLILQAVLLLCGVGLGAFLQVRGKMIHWLASIPMLVLHIGYLWLAVVWITGFDDMLPREITQWILPPERMLFYQFCFIMPGGFYAGLRLACFPMRMARGKDLGLSLALAIGIPLGTYLMVYIGNSMTRRFWNFPDFFGIIFFIMLTIGTVIVLAAVVRGLTMLYLIIMGKGQHGMMVLTVLVGIVLPLGGLWLNHHIPFPFDFQTPAVYLMALVNGVVLLLPLLENRPGYNRAVWLAQGLMFPFTLYFFLVFLPFLPLSLPAMVVFGAGFLILSPLALFVIHGMRLVEGFHRERARLGWAPAAGMILAAGMIWPALYTGRGLLHKQVMHEAIAYVYEKSPGEPQRFDQSRGMLKITLQNLKDMNHGFELPFLTSYYNWLVFDGLVLSDSKMQHLHRVFFGESLEPKKEHEGIAGDLFGTGSRNNGSWNRLRRPPPTGVKLQRVEVTSGIEQGVEKALAHLTMKNPTAQLSEFVTSIELPPGVYISGYWLHVGEEKVPGRIFEKKTALWVYKMIRDTGPRDPGLLVYKNPGEVELRVYPFNADQERKCEIEFIFPAGGDPDIRIGGTRLALAPRRDAPVAVGSRIEGEGWHLAVSPEGQRRLPRVTRTPYLHFILDRSAHAVSLDRQFERMARISREFPEAEYAMLSAANYEQALITEEPVPVSEVSGSGLRSKAESLPQRGGLFEGRMVQAALMEYRRRCADREQGAAWSMRYPVIVVVRPSHPVAAEPGALACFALIAPETGGYWRAAEGDQLNWVGFSEDSKARTSPLEVVLFRNGNRYQAAACADHEMLSVYLAGAAGSPPDVLDGGGTPRALEGLNTLPAQARYAQGARAWLGYLDSVYDSGNAGELLPRMVKISRATGILLPVTSYIVVENTAQWKILEQKEGLKLDNQAALDFMNTPEPGFWILLAGLLLFVKLRKTRRGGGDPGTA